MVGRARSGDRRGRGQDSVAAGEPDRLLGYPVVLDEAMPAVGAVTEPVIFGDFGAGYVIVDWSTMRLLRDPFTSKPNVTSTPTAGSVVGCLTSTRSRS